MRVVCIDDSFFEELEKGKIYDVVDTADGIYYIKKESGAIVGFKTYRFKVIEETNK